MSYIHVSQYVIDDYISIIPVIESLTVGEGYISDFRR